MTVEMDIGVVVVFILVFLVSALGLKKRRKLPPGPFTIPYIGTPSILLKLKGRHAHEVFLEETKQHGNVFAFSIGIRYIVVLNGFDAIHEALVKNATACAGRMEELRHMMNIKEKEVGKLL